VSALDIDTLDWDKENGLIPAVVQDSETRQVLMLGYVNRESLAATLKSGLVTFYSRSKQRLWQKGETSGHTLELVSIAPDCDGDALLLLVRPHGPTCHRGTTSCFDP
jgi:phosphoribosyl-ATP pyrophosphohydrolase/phosphoribosyl-AMP cyclohydrolase